MKEYIKLFIICGMTGLLMECIYTGFYELFHNNFLMTSKTSLWMFPIYGLACFIKPLYMKLKCIPLIIRLVIYAVIITATEYLSGYLLSGIKCCPWNYEEATLKLNGLIRLDYFPLWMGAGYIFEKIVRRCSM